MRSAFRVSIFLIVTLATSYGEVEFRKDVRPILAGLCFECHGPDEAAVEADLRLDSFEAATADLGGYAAVVPGDPAASELMKRVRDHGDPMPPEKANKEITEEQIAVLEKWIAEGAEYEPHWAFQKPTLPEVPAVDDGEWAKNEIDHFVLARLNEEGLHPSPEADPLVLARRLFLDLNGVVPTVEEADRFAEDAEARGIDGAVVALVDDLLSRPAYGERWARSWLDLARYADTNGYEKDRERTIWPYRDWVIDALNQDMPYDQFTIEQLAGDMLPGATPEQVIATGFHRNTMQNEEGGVDPLEFRFHAMVDRVATTGTVWMGITTGCAQCHTHKYDPITHTDYFALMALLDDADEVEIQVPDSEIVKRQGEADSRIRGIEDALLANSSDDDPGYASWLAEAREKAVKWVAMEPAKMDSNLPILEHEGDGVVFASGDFTKRDTYSLQYALDLGTRVTGLRIESLPDERLPMGGAGRSFYEGRKGNFFLSEVDVRVDGADVEIGGGSFDYGKAEIGKGKVVPENVFDNDGSSGWSTADRETEPHQLVLEFAKPVALSGAMEVDLLFERHFVVSLGKFRISYTTDEGDIAVGDYPASINDALVDLKAENEREVRLAFLKSRKNLAGYFEKIAKFEKERPKLGTTLAFEERKQGQGRSTLLRHRGEYTSPREEVFPAVPVVFNPGEKQEVTDRLALARWLVSEENPLAARVAVNRAWAAFFGRGIVSTLGDFGVQSPEPSHEELLDWLSVDWMKGGWSMKALHRKITTSATYRQRSDVSESVLLVDANNALLTRGPRFRMDGEMVRDALLSGSGLMDDRVGGRSVYPPQPNSVMAMAYGGAKWPVSKGADRYRRSLYTFSKRTAPFAAYTVFDAPTGEVCVAKRDRSNTPLQALTLMNDAMFFEMAQAVGREVAGEEEKPISERIEAVFRQFFTRYPTDEEARVLADYFDDQLTRLNAGELVASEIMGTDTATAEEAAWALLTRVVMNLDEVITKG